MKITPSSFLQVDFISGTAASVWAVTSLYVTELASLVAPEAAGAFALAAFTRWIVSTRSA